MRACLISRVHPRCGTKTQQLSVSASHPLTLCISITLVPLSLWHPLAHFLHDHFINVYVYYLVTHTHMCVQIERHTKKTRGKARGKKPERQKSRGMVVGGGWTAVRVTHVVDGGDSQHHLCDVEARDLMRQHVLSLQQRHLFRPHTHTPTHMRARPHARERERKFEKESASERERAR